MGEGQWGTMRGIVRASTKEEEKAQCRVGMDVLCVYVYQRYQGWGQQATGELGLGRYLAGRL